MARRSSAVRLALGARRPSRAAGHRPAPATLGLVLGAGLVGALLLAQALQGRIPFGPEGTLSDLLVAVLHCVLLAYLCAAYLALIRSAERVAAAVQPHLPTGEAARRLLSGLPPRDAPERGWGVAVLAGLTFTTFGPYLTEPELMRPLEFWDSRRWAPEAAWHRVLGLCIGVALGAFGYAVFHVSRQLSRMAPRLGGVTLFDQRPLRPFAQQGLTNALLTAGVLSLVSLFALDHGVTPMLLGFAGSTALLIGIALLLPVRGVHRRIRREKEAHLAWCDAEIRHAREHVRGGRAAGGAPPGRLADVLAYRALVEEAPEWPFDSPAVRRILLYLLIPLGSWVASAMVQSLLERLVFAG